MIKNIFPLSALIIFIYCNNVPPKVQNYSIETLMSNSRSTGGYFSKDASKLLFSSNKTGFFNIYEVDLSTKEETQKTNSKKESYFVQGYAPLTNEIIYSSDKGGNENSHLYLIRNNKSIDLTPGENTKASFFGWTRDQTSMYFQSNSRNPKYFDLYKIDMETLETEVVFQNDMAYSYSSISENDKYLAFELNISRNEDKMFLFDLETKERIEISNKKANYSGQGFDKNDEIYFYTTNYEGEFYYLMSYNITSGKRDLVYKTNWDVRSSYLTKNNTYRVISINEDAKNRLVVINNNDNSTVNFKGFEGLNIDSVYFSENEQILRISARGSKSPGEIYTYNLANDKLNKITSNLNSKIHPSNLAEGEVIRYESFDGLKIPAILYKPKSTTREEKFPALVWVHGGPGGQSRIGYRPLIQYLVNHGYAILAVNNRGSSGYGKTFYSLDDKNHGEKDLKDCIWGKYWLEKQEYVDKEKIGIIGGSYGGFMTMAAMTFMPEEFKAGVNIYGVTNWVRTLRSIPAYWESSRKQLYNEMGDPYSTDSIRLYNISPLFHAKNIKNPVMILQGANDPRVLQIESDEMVKAAKDAGVYVEYMLFEDAGHGFAKKQQQIDGYSRILAFLEKTLKKN